MDINSRTLEREGGREGERERERGPNILSMTHIHVSKDFG